MIPDFPVLKEELNRAMSRYMKLRMARGPLGQVPRGRVFEGDSNVLIREDSSHEETEIREFGSQISLPGEDIRNLNLPDLLESLDKLAEEIITQQAKHFYETISQGVEEVGNTLSANNEP